MPGLEVIEEVAEELEAEALIEESAILESEASLAQINAERNAVNSFAQRALGSAKSFGQWMASAAQSRTFGNLLNLTMVGVITYQLVKGHASQVQKSGQLIKLSAAIAGAEERLKTGFQAIVNSSQKVLNGPTAAKLSPEQKQTMEENIALGADGYWDLNGPMVMAGLAQAPIYDASS
jgi:hypothetical protein